jgi:hypothetical protein
MELWPISKTMFRFEARAFSTSERAIRRSSFTGRGLRLILA